MIIIIRLRPYKPCDAAHIVKWIKDEYSFRQWCADRHENYPITESELNSYYDKTKDSELFFEMTAFDETGVVGHLILRFVDEEKKTIRFGFIIVSNLKRGMGYGKELLRLAIDYAFNILKAETISLGVFENNPTAYRCYKSVGFSEVGEDKDHYCRILGEDWKCIEMQLSQRGLYKHSIPILEYDANPNAIIMPSRKNLYSFPEKAVFPFLYDESEKYALASNFEKIGEFISITKIYPIYKAIHNGHEVCLCQAPLGSSAAVQLLDFLIGYGVKEIIAIGSCGALKDFPENEFLIPTEALRDEGASYHYLPPKRTVAINKKAISAISLALESNSLKYTLCKTWSTDGFYRETVDMVNYRKEEGCSVVEMECAGLAACAEFRNAIFGQILFTADTLANPDIYDERDWGVDSFSIGLKIALDAVCKI